MDLTLTFFSKLIKQTNNLELKEPQLQPGFFAHH